MKTFKAEFKTYLSWFLLFFVAGMIGVTLAHSGCELGLSRVRSCKWDGSFDWPTLKGLVIMLSIAFFGSLFFAAVAQWGHIPILQKFSGKKKDE